MKKRTISLVAALTPLIACASTQPTQVSVAQNLTTSDVPQAIAQSDVLWIGSDFYYHLLWIRDSDQSVIHSSAVYIEASNNYRIDVYKTIEKDPFGSMFRCGVWCDIEKGELAGSLQLRPISNTEFVVESATQTAAFLEGELCSTQTTPADTVNLSCYSPTGPVGNTPSTIVFELSP